MATIDLGAEVAPGGPFAIVDDSNFRGSYRVVATIPARDAIIADNKKIGMLVGVLSDGKVYRLDSTGPDVWSVFSSGGGTGAGALQAKALAPGNIAVLSGTGTFDTVPLVANDIIFLPFQSSPITGGLWTIQAGPWTRPAEFFTGDAAAGSLIVVLQGSAGNVGTLWQCVTSGAASVIDTNAISFKLIPNLATTATWANTQTFSMAIQATAGMNAGSQLITSVATPVAGTDAANKAYVDTAVAGAVQTVTAGAGLINSGTALNPIIDVVAADATVLVTANNIAVSQATAVATTILPNDSASTGISFKSAKEDHRHAISTAAAGAIQIGDAAAEGVSLSFARADHTHLLTAPPAPANVTKDTATPGVSLLPARADHKHDINTGVPLTLVFDIANTEGTLTSLARSDHRHSLGTPLAPPNISKVAAAPGTSGIPARSDHQHNIDTAVVVDIGVANAEGVATSLSRADHVHNLPFTPVQTALAAATSSISVNTQKITSLGTPTLAADATTKLYVDTLIAGVVQTVTAGAGLINSGTASNPIIDVVAADATILVTANNIAVSQATATPSTIQADAAGSVGVSLKSAKEDHVHPIAADTAGAIQIGDTSNEGALLTFSRADHRHSLAAPAAPVNVTKAAASTGTAPEPARADHKHDVTTAVAVDVGIANAEGVSTSLARADHVHNLPFTPVQTALAAATGSVSVNNQKITNLAAPTLATDAATKAYVDAQAQGLDPKQSVRVLPTADFSTFIPSGTGVGKTLTAPTDSATFNTQDGVLLVATNRVLVATAGGTVLTPDLSNGIYTVTSLGDGAGTSFVLTRATDADTNAKVTAGMFTFVTEGTDNKDNGWLLITNDPISIDVTPLEFVQFSGAGQIIAGAGLTKIGNQLDVVANVDGSIVVNPNDVQVGVLATDGQHGTRGGGTLHAVATTITAGFESAADKTKLDASGILTSIAPVSVSLSANAVGVGTESARNDHRHQLDQSIVPTWTGIHTFSANVICNADVTLGNASTDLIAANGRFTTGLIPTVANDNLLDLGATDARWKTLHVGPGSVVVHNDNINTIKVSLGYSGLDAQLLSTGADLRLDANIGPTASPNLTFVKEVNHTIFVAASTTLNTAGANLTIRPGDAAATNANGGDITIRAGAKAGTGTDGIISIGDVNTSAITFNSHVVNGVLTPLVGTDAANKDYVDSAGGTLTVTAIKTANYTAVIKELVRVDPTGGVFTVTLPTAVGVSGKQIIVKNVTASGINVTIDGAGAETIDDALTFVLNTAHQSVTLASDGANWMVI